MGWFIGLGIGGLVIGLGKLIVDAFQESDAQKLREKQYQQQLESDYRAAISGFDSIASSLKNLAESEIPGLEAQITAYDRDLARWQGQYDIQTGEIQRDIESFDDLLGMWDMSYDAQTKQAQTQGKEQFSSLLANWSDAEVLAADRGMGGSMQLIAQQQRDKAVAYAGEDLSLLSGGDGLFGSSYETLLANLASQKSRYESELSILTDKLVDTEQRLQDERSVITEQLGVLEGSLLSNKESVGDMYGRIQEQYNISAAAAKKAGMTNDASLKRIKEWLDNNKQYAGV